MNSLKTFEEANKLLKNISTLESLKKYLYFENLEDKYYSSQFLLNNCDYISSSIDLYNDNDSILRSKTYLNHDFYNLHSSQNKKLEDLDLDELLAKLYTYRCDQIEFRKILSLINKKRFALWLEKIIRKLKKILKLLNNNNEIRIQNKREFFRKIYCFFFKNLDDTHATVIFN